MYGVWRIQRNRSSAKPVKMCQSVEEMWQDNLWNNLWPTNKFHRRRYIAVCSVFWKLRDGTHAHWTRLFRNLKARLAAIAEINEANVTTTRLKYSIWRGNMCTHFLVSFFRMASETKTVEMVQRQRTSLCSGKTSGGLSSSPSSTPTSGRCTSRPRPLSGRWRRWVSGWLYLVSVYWTLVK